MFSRELLVRVWTDLTAAPTQKRPLRESGWSIALAGGTRVLLSGPQGEMYEVLVLGVDPSDPDARLVRASEAGAIPEG